MSKITSVFKKQPGYVGYIVAGDGGMQRSLMMMCALVEGGVNILEIGVPFSDPVADGPVIQTAAARSVANGTTLENVLDLVQQFRKYHSTPIILFSYFNPIYIAEKKYDFYARAKAVGVDGCLIVDAPIEEMSEYHAACIKNDIDPIFLIAPSTSIERIKMINDKAKGMLYYVCRKGTTGIKNDFPLDMQHRLMEIKSIVTLPVVVGFGISHPEMAKTVIKRADGFVIGSLFVQAVAENKSAEQLTVLARSFNPLRCERAVTDVPPTSTIDIPSGNFPSSLSRVEPLGGVEGSTRYK